MRRQSRTHNVRAGQEAVFLFLRPGLLRHKPGLQAGHVLKNVAGATLERAKNDQCLDQTQRLMLAETARHAQAHEELCCPNKRK